MKKLVLIRRASQIFFSLLFIYILWSTTYPLSGFLPAGLFFTADPLVMIMASVSERVLLPGIVLSALMLILSAIIGRFFCGWVCPLGAAFDLVSRFRKRFPRQSDVADRAIRKVKFCILTVVAAAAVLGAQLAWIFDPMVIMARFVSLNLIPAATLLLNSLFIFLIRDLKLGSSVQDFYRAIKPTLLGVKAAFFSHSLAIFLFFLAICALALFMKRFWCRAICPLGAIYALVSRRALLRRTFKGCTACGICKSDCRMGAISDDLDYAQGECVMCMDCIYDCPQHVTRFEWFWGQLWGQTLFDKSGSSGPDPKNDRKKGLSRRDFLSLVVASTALLGFRFRPQGGATGDGVIRPPAALKEPDFLNRCVRCGNCMKVCITNGLQPAFLQSGLGGIWTPHLIPEIGYCEYQCTLCGKTCPTGAIPALSIEEKKKTRLGLAHIDPEICIPWAEGKQCIVCEEHCPVAEKAITLTKEKIGGIEVYRPAVDEKLCVGCGICQNKCPVRPVRAIRVAPRQSDRT